MAEIHHLYDLSLVSYSYTNGMHILQIPIYIKHYQQQRLELFSLQSVPVPYYPNSKSSDDNQTALLYILNAKREPPTLRLKKLIEVLSQYSFKVKFLRGKDITFNQSQACNNYQ